MCHTLSITIILERDTQGDDILIGIVLTVKQSWAYGGNNEVDLSPYRQLHMTQYFCF